MSAPVSPVAPSAALEAVRVGGERLETSVSALDAEQLAAPSILPGWSRGHVVAHLAHNAQACAEVTLAALAGRPRALYPGGQGARDEAIERDAGRPPREALEDLRSAQRRLQRLWESLDDASWNLPVPFRDGTVAHLLASRWREVEIHHLDLDVGYPSERWAPTFAEHAIAFLLPRLPEAGSVELVARDTGGRWRRGAPPGHARIEGRAHELAAWLAGRTTADALVVSGADVPDLGPWP